MSACAHEAVNSVGRHGIAVVGEIDAKTGSNPINVEPLSKP